MNFSKLYKDNKEIVERALRAMWCGESGNESQTAYSHKLREVIKEILAPATAFPVVQCMNSYKSVHSVTSAEAEELVGGLWTKVLPPNKHWPPYEHQYKCWDALLRGRSDDGKPMSICVTTGTGSGKTECFMIPLVKDLLDNPQNNQIQALFLYPLNALMEDQKERLEELLSGTNLTYTVYNGDLPEDIPADNDVSDEAEHIRKRIKLIRGYDEATGTCKFEHMLYTRKMVRNNPPNILLTNPTMLEYILLRNKDAVLTNPELKSLRWIAIDETHSYTGAGAAELAMLLRRVLLAFGVAASDVRFATSSATFGNGSNPDQERRQLQEFIAGITGILPDQVAVVGGKRVGESELSGCADEHIWRTIFDKEYIRLDELFPNSSDIEEQLHLLDEMCERVPVINGMPQMKAKVHYFYRVPNNGLFVRLTDTENGTFKIYTSNHIQEDSSSNPLLELCRCKHCGEYVAIAQMNTTPGADFGRYKAIERDDSDMFDLLEEEEDGSIKNVIIGLSKEENVRGDNNTAVVADNGKIITSTGEVDLNDWHLVANTHCECPYCNSKLTRKQNNDEDDTADAQVEADNAYLIKFRTSPEFISRILAPSILDNLDKVSDSATNKIILHDGQQYISFADSRQLAAKATMKQNLEQERDWFYSTIFHGLCRKKASLSNVQKELQELTALLPTLVTDMTKMAEVAARITQLNSQTTSYLTWNEVADLLLKDKYCKVFCSQFIMRSGDTDELDREGNIPNHIMEKYVQSIMVMYLSKRPTSAAAPETLGLFCPCYPQIKGIELPEAVEKFNRVITHEEHRISKDDWHNYIQIFIDYVVRTGESLFLKLSDTNPIDIFACERFATEKPRRRPVMKPKLEAGKVSTSRMVRYLCELIVQDKGISVKDAYNTYFLEISNVIDALWDDLNNPTNKLLDASAHWDDENRQFALDKNDPRRFNLANMCLKLYEDVYLCDANTDSSIRHSTCLRPIENNFKGFSPYLGGNSVRKLSADLYEKWDNYPYFDGSGEAITSELIRSWAQNNRRLLWDNHLWGEDGIFENRLTNIHQKPNLFIQAEHTAQVDKDVSRTLQMDFKEHTINILACSTTMEMGVDLGNLEVVMLTSVPPQPANYKQRAGRSGRNNKVQSVCITLCSSDAIGLRTLFNPIPTIINRPVKVPMVDLMSPQVVQRHINSYLIRAFGVFTDGDNGGKLNQKVFNYYSPFTGCTSGKKVEIVNPNTNVEVSPIDMLGSKAGTMYDLFNTKCIEQLDDAIRNELTQLIKGTIYDNKVDLVVRNASEANKRCYRELNEKLENLKMAYGDADGKFRTKLKMQYYEVMLSRLLNFWATHRFTPNANMPVNVLTLDLNSTGKKSLFTTGTSSNPSYGLREAIAQYAPGNSIVVDGVVYTVRGIQFKDMYEGTRTFKQIFRNSDQCVIDDNTLEGQIRWNANSKYALELIQPVGFVPDMNEDKSRIVDENRFTHVSAQLIGTTNWPNDVNEPHLFSVRNNLDSGYAKILYYNEGIGFGYCFCARCGRMVLETEVADQENPLANLPFDMNPRKSKVEGRPNYHFEIFGKEFRRACPASNDKNTIRRNVIIGDLVQTDFAEIRIRHKGQKSWINTRREENLMFTLGIVFTQSLLDILGKERGAVDFAVMPNGHLCLFDTNPGGAGYSNQMKNIPLMKEIIKSSKKMLELAKEHNSKDMLLNKQTLRFINYIDIEGALSWIQEEEEACGVLPEEIASVSSDATETTLTHILDAQETTSHENIFFVNDRVETWDYNGDGHGWRNHFLNRMRMRDQMTTLCVARNTDTPLPEPAIDMLRSAKAGWAKDVISITNPYDDVYPIAYIDNVMYFTNDIASTGFNSAWGSNTIFCSRSRSITETAKPIDCSYKDTTKVILLEGSNASILKTNALGATLHLSKAKSIIDTFIEHAKSCQDKLYISYQDEHLKSVLGMILTLQTIEYFIKQIKKDFEIKFLMEKYEDNNYHGGITGNLKDYHERDLKLEELVNDWLYGIDGGYGISGEISPIISNEPRSLTHWRVLTLECGNKRLSIYPDGGFANGWSILRDWSVNTKRYTTDNTDTNDIITLKRIADIKFDISIEDINA